MLWLYSFVFPPPGFAGDAELEGIARFQYFTLVTEVQVILKGEIAGLPTISYLATLDPITGEVSKIGDTGHGNCSALDFNPAGELFVTCQRMEEPFEPVLVRLDTLTGMGTEVGPTGITEQLSDITNIGGYAIHVYEELETSHNVHAIDDMTGDSMLIGQPGLEGIGNALFAWGDDAVKLVTWVDGANQVYELDAETAQPEFVTELQVFDNTGGLMALVEEGPCLLLAADSIMLEPLAGAILAGLDSSNESATTKGAITSFEAVALLQMPIIEKADVTTAGDFVPARGLVFIDLDAGTAVIKTAVGSGDYLLDGLAVRERIPAQVPTLSQWGLIATAMLLFAGALLFMRRRGLSMHG